MCILMGAGELNVKQGAQIYMGMRWKNNVDTAETDDSTEVR
jgi:hypothetical protein